MRCLVVLLLCVFPSAVVGQVILSPTPFDVTQISINAEGESDSGSGFASLENLDLFLFTNEYQVRGIATLRAEAFPDRIELTLDGTITTNTFPPEEPGIGLGAAGEIIGSIPVPQLGDMLTPVFAKYSDSTPNSGGFVVFQDLLSSAHGAAFAAATATGSQQVGDPNSEMTELLAGDRISFRANFQFGQEFAPGFSGPFSKTVTLTLEVPPPPVSNGDLNGDQILDIVDVAIARRILAEAPVN